MATGEKENPISAEAQRKLEEAKRKESQEQMRRRDETRREFNLAFADFAIVYDDTNTRVLLRVTEAVTAVPEPHSWALWLAGAAVLGALRPRRQHDSGPFVLNSLLRTR